MAPLSILSSAAADMQQHLNQQHAQASREATFDASHLQSQTEAASGYVLRAIDVSAACVAAVTLTTIAAASVPFTLGGGVAVAGALALATGAVAASTAATQAAEEGIEAGAGLASALCVEGAVVLDALRERTCDTHPLEVPAPHGDGPPTLPAPWRDLVSFAMHR